MELDDEMLAFLYFETLDVIEKACRRLRDESVKKGRIICAATSHAQKIK